MRYEIHIEMDNDAFMDGNKSYEVNRILADVVHHIDSFGVKESKALRDINGGYVGIAHLIEEV